MADLIDPDSKVIDLCCGIGPFVIPIAKRGIDVLANDLNPGTTKLLIIYKLLLVNSFNSSSLKGCMFIWVYIQ